MAPVAPGSYLFGRRQAMTETSSADRFAYGITGHGSREGTRFYADRA
jgi:hypothetical protein